jgi:hypothetical protein
MSKAIMERILYLVLSYQLEVVVVQEIIPPHQQPETQAVQVAEVVQDTRWEWAA